MDNWTTVIEACRAGGIHFLEHVSLADRCTFKIGGEVDLFLQPASEEQIARALAAVEDSRLPLLILGRGSNLLFPDEGFRGVALHIGPRFAGIRLVDERTIDCDSGAALTELCLFAWEHGLAGLEFAYGIPGSVGGAVYMNAGAYGGEMKDVLLSSRHIGPGGVRGELEGAEMALSYRHSAYAGGDRVITGGRFRLNRDDKDAIRARMDDYMGRRRAKQPLEHPSAGSTFKRPEGAYASALIDRCGLKGRRVGGAVVSEKHAGFVINAGGATARDVRELIGLVQAEVKAQTGYDLACEVKIVS